MYSIITLSIWNEPTSPLWLTDLLSVLCKWMTWRPQHRFNKQRREEKKGTYDSPLAPYSIATPRCCWSCPEGHITPPPSPARLHACEARACSTTESYPREWCGKSWVFWLPRVKRTTGNESRRKYKFENAGAKRKHVSFGSRSSCDDFTVGESTCIIAILPWQVSHITFVHHLVLHSKWLDNNPSFFLIPAQNQSVWNSTVSRSKSGCFLASHPCGQTRGYAARAGQSRSAPASLWYLLHSTNAKKQKEKGK